MDPRKPGSLPPLKVYDLRGRDTQNPPNDPQICLEDAQRTQIKTLKRQRAGKKSSIARRINTVKDIILHKGSRTKLQSHIRELYATLKSAGEIHENLMNFLNENDSEYSDDWLSELNENVDACNAEVLEYLIERGDDSDSLVSSFSSESEPLESDFEPPMPISSNFEPRISTISEQFSNMSMHDSTLLPYQNISKTVPNTLDNRYDSSPNLPNVTQANFSTEHLPPTHMSVCSNPERPKVIPFQMKRSCSAPLINPHYQNVCYDSLNDYLPLNVQSYNCVDYDMALSSNESETSSHVSAHQNGPSTSHNVLSSVSQVVSNPPHTIEITAPVSMHPTGSISVHSQAPHS